MTHNHKTLVGRRCIVTGGGTGIGRGIALVLARCGAAVTITGRRQEKLQETVDLAAKEDLRVLQRAMDVTDAADVATGIAALAEQMGGLDVLVNNAGVGGPNGCAVDGPDCWDLVIRTNLDGIFFCAREAAKVMSDGGRILNISSVLGKFGVPGYTAYCTSKHGVIGFTKALALECAPRKITVNAICPGWVDTSMADDGFEAIGKAMGVSTAEAKKGALAQVPLGEIVQPDEIGEVAAYLCSDAARNVTGQAISVCGGSTMG